MLALVSALAFAGYTLVYAAVANGGALAGRPWDALKVDAYDVQKQTGGGAIEHAARNVWTVVKKLGGWVLHSEVLP